MKMFKSVYISSSLKYISYLTTSRGIASRIVSFLETEFFC